MLEFAEAIKPHVPILSNLCRTRSVYQIAIEFVISVCQSPVLEQDERKRYDTIREKETVSKLLYAHYKHVPTKL